MELLVILTTDNVLTLIAMAPRRRPPSATIPAARCRTGSRRAWNHQGSGRGWRNVGQRTAFFMIAAIFFSSAGVSCLTA